MKTISNLIVSRGRLWLLLVAPVIIGAPDLSAQNIARIPTAKIISDEEPWPRQYTVDDATVMLYQPTVERWDNAKLDARFAIGITQRGDAQPVYGSFRAHAETITNAGTRTVTILNIGTDEVEFPDAPDRVKLFAGYIGALVPDKPLKVSLDKLLAEVPAQDVVTKDTVTTTTLNKPPRVIVSFNPAVLLAFDGKPVFRPVADSGLEAAVNTPATLLRPANGGPFYLLTNDGVWLRAAGMASRWTVSPAPPEGLDRIPPDHPVAQAIKAVYPPTGAVLAAPDVVTSETPAELIQFDGKPTYDRVGDLPLVRVGNTDSAVFFHSDLNKFFVLISGRWFTAAELEGPWTYVPHNALPPEFAQISEGDPSADVLASIAGTREAEEAAKEAQIPTIARVRADDAPEIEPDYDGEPFFDDVPGTPLAYAVNTTWAVLRFGGGYYCCRDGLWFQSDRPFGSRWRLCVSLPRGIFLMPPSCPLYYTRFCDIAAFNDGYVTYACTPGYYGTYIDPVTGVCVYGTGWAYPAYVSPGYYAGYPWTYGFGTLYWRDYGFANHGRYIAHTSWFGQRDRDGHDFWRAESGRWGGRFDHGRWNVAARSATPYSTFGNRVSTHENLVSSLSREPRGGKPHHTVARVAAGAAVAGAFVHELRAGSKGELYRRSGEAWQRRESGQWKETDQSHPVDRAVVHSDQQKKKTDSGAGRSAVPLSRDNRYGRSTIPPNGNPMVEIRPVQPSTGRSLVDPRSVAEKQMEKSRRSREEEHPPESRGSQRGKAGELPMPGARVQIPEPGGGRMERREEPKVQHRDPVPQPVLPKVERREPQLQPKVERHEQPRVERHDPPPAMRREEPRQPKADGGGRDSRGERHEDKKDDKKK